MKMFVPILLGCSFVIQFSDAFTVPLKPRSFSRVMEHRMTPLDTTSFLTAVEVFDGSTVDPVVVSNVFWASLKGKIIAVVIGQLLATIVFAFLASFVAGQVSQAGDFLAKTLTSDPPSKTQATGQTTFIKASSSSSPAITPDFQKLVICIAIDVIGSSSAVVPILGDATDVIYAPIAGAVLRSLYGGSNLLFLLEFTEEILPFTDILPLATICWVVDTFFADSDIARLLQLGVFSPANAQTKEQDAIETTVVDTTARELPPADDFRKR